MSTWTSNKPKEPVKSAPPPVAEEPIPEPVEEPEFSVEDRIDVLTRGGVIHDLREPEPDPEPKVEDKPTFEDVWGFPPDPEPAPPTKPPVVHKKGRKKK